MFQTLERTINLNHGTDGDKYHCDGNDEDDNDENDHDENDENENDEDDHDDNEKESVGH